jgi:hypothetical protein
MNTNMNTNTSARVGNDILHTLCDDGNYDFVARYEIGARTTLQYILSLPLPLLHGLYFLFDFFFFMVFI